MVHPYGLACPRALADAARSPHIETMTNATEENGRLELRMRPPEGDGNGFIKTLRVTKSEDL